MLATVRRYRGLPEPTVTALVERAADICTVLTTIRGVRGSQLIRTRDGAIVVTVGTDESCLAESGRRFRAWADAHVQGFRSVDEADVWVGSVVLEVRGSEP